nr:transposase DNA-binding-containing protein [Bradyrhizobium sp. 177]
MEGECWIDRESSGCEFRDARLGDRFRKLLTQIGSAMGQSIPLVCQDWANTKAAYRFFSNDRVSEADILAGHFQSHVIVPPPLKVSFLCCTTQPSLAISARSQKRSASPRA